MHPSLPLQGMSSHGGPAIATPVRRKPPYAHAPLQSSPLAIASSPLPTPTPTTEASFNGRNSSSQAAALPFPRSDKMPALPGEGSLRPFPVPAGVEGEIYPRDYQTALRRFRSLSMTPSKKDRPQWTDEAIRKKYTPEKTIELYDFTPEFETADLNQMLEPYQHHKCERGGYRIKWLSDTRALALFRRAEMASRVLKELSSNKLMKIRPYRYVSEDLAVFNRRYNEQEGDQLQAAGPANDEGTGSRPSTPGGRALLEEEAIRIKYRPDVTVELYDFSMPLETADLQNLFKEYKSENNIVRVKWFNKNRAIAWFTSPQLVERALAELADNTLAKIRPYHFSAADMKYFLPDSLKTPSGSPSLSRRRTVSRHTNGLGRRNTVSGASHYHYHGAVAAATTNPSEPQSQDILPIPKLPF